MFLLAFAGSLLTTSGSGIKSSPAVGLPYTERMFERCLMIPMNTALSNEDVDKRWLKNNLFNVDADSIDSVDVSSDPIENEFKKYLEKKIIVFYTT